MNRGATELGRLLRGFRISEGLTQHELADRVGCSRSAIALMEQGRRLLPGETLKATASLLCVPRKIIEPFLTEPLQARRNTRAHRGPVTIPFRILCISGITGAGKTTLAEAISRTYQVPRIGSHSNARRYLKDLTIDQKRWAFEAQVAFLVGKCSEIRSRVEIGESVIVERWIDEDISVYKKLFAESGYIDERSQWTYTEISKLVSALLPSPEYIFYCHCSPETAYQRILTRGRGDSNLHDIDYLTRTFQLYEEWLDAVSGPEVYKIDTEQSDLSEPGILESVFAEIQWIFSHDLEVNQLSLLVDKTQDRFSLKHLSPLHKERWQSLHKPTAQILSTTATPMLAPLAYLAAPFTGEDVDAPTQDGAQESLFDYGAPHGRIPRAGFRNELLAVERALREHGFSVLLPHRDVNDWGRTTLMPAQAMAQCTQHVSSCDIFVAILGTSCGAHYEFGLAQAAGKPCLIIHSKSMHNSFLANGLAGIASTDILEIHVNSIIDGARLIQEGEVVNQFLQRHFGHRKGGGI